MSRELLSLLLYAAFLYAMYELYKAYLAQQAATPAVVFVGTAAATEDDEKGASE